MSANPTLLRLVPDTSDAEVAVTGSLVHRCPHVQEVDTGTVTITWRCREMTVELHSLVAYLASWADQAISHEEITAQIEKDLDSLDGIAVQSVTSSWRTAGLAVTVWGR